MKRLLPTLFLATACTTSVEDPPSGCTSISQCVIGQVCNASGQCVPEPTNTVIGRFECVPGPSSTDPGRTTVIANVGMQRVPFNGVVECTFPGDDLFLVSMIPPATMGGYEFKLNVVVPWEMAQKGGRIEMVRPWYSNEPQSANVARYVGLTFERVLGHSAGGYIQFDGPAQEGKPLSGYIEIPLDETREGTTVGVPCERGMVDCSDSVTVLSDAFCMRPTEGFDPHVPICTAFCKTDADCERYGGVCVTLGNPNGICFRECAGGCEPPLQCSEFYDDPRVVCFKKL